MPQRIEEQLTLDRPSIAVERDAFAGTEHGIMIRMRHDSGSGEFILLTVCVYILYY